MNLLLVAEGTEELTYFHITVIDADGEVINIWTPGEFMDIEPGDVIHVEWRDEVNTDPAPINCSLQQLEREAAEQGGHGRRIRVTFAPGRANLTAHRCIINYGHVTVDSNSSTDSRSTRDDDFSA